MAGCHWSWVSPDGEHLGCYPCITVARHVLHTLVLYGEVLVGAEAGIRPDEALVYGDHADTIFLICIAPLRDIREDIGGAVGVPRVTVRARCLVTASEGGRQDLHLHVLLRTPQLVHLVLANDFLGATRWEQGEKE